MNLGTYRHLTPEELKPLEGKEWIGFARDEPGDTYRLEGVEIRVPDHPTPLTFVFQIATRVTEGSKEQSRPAYIHIPYPHRLPPAVREYLTETMHSHYHWPQFMQRLHAVAQPIG